MTQDLHERARASFEAARSAAASARKTIALLAVALSIVWLSGLEGTLQTVLKQERSFREINSLRQEADRKLEEAYSEIVKAKAQIDRVSNLPREYEEKRKLTVEQAIQEALRELAEAKKNKNETEIQRWTDKWKARRQDLEDIKNLSAQQDRLIILIKESKALEHSLRKAYDAAKAESLSRRHEVDFELLGIKLKTPVLLAPILWSVLLLVFLEYLILAYRKVVELGKQGLRTLARFPELSSDDIADIAGMLPPWTARDAAPAFALKRPSADVQSVEDQPWVSRVFGHKTSRRAIDVLRLLVPRAALLLQLRVAWVGIELTRHLGSNQSRSWASLGVMLATGAAYWLARTSFVSDDVRNDKDTPADAKNRFRLFLIGGVVVVGVAVVTSIDPSLGIKIGLIFQELLWILGVLSALWMAVPIAQEYLPGFGWRLPIPGRLTTRRNAILVVLGLGVVVAAGLRLRSSRNPRFSARRRQKKAAGVRPGVAGAGFYARVRSPRVSNAVLPTKESEDPAKAVERSSSREELVRPSRTEEPVSQSDDDNSARLIVHYIDNRGEVWASGQWPKGAVKKFGIFDQDDNEFFPEERLSIQNSEENPPDKQSDRELGVHPIPSTPLLSTGKLASDFFRPVGPRVQLASASWAFEQAAMEILRSKPLLRKHSEQVCKLLVYSINHDIYFKSRRSHPPSYRLYDLLAGVCVRFRQDVYFQELLRLITDAKQEGLFETRMAKWKDPLGLWRKRWRNRKVPLKWASSSDGVVF